MSESERIELKPGIVVNLKSSINGGVAYQRRELEAPEASDDVDVARWETTRITSDAGEHKRAVQIRSAALARIRSECYATRVGFLFCRPGREPELRKAVEDSREMIREFNATALHTRIAVFPLLIEFRDADETICRAIRDEMIVLLDDLERGVRDLDVDAIRRAANQAKRSGAILDGTQSRRVGAAISYARRTAREITRQIEDRGAALANAAFEARASFIRESRFAFLDMDDSPGALAAPDLVAQVDQAPDVAVEANNAALIAALAYVDPTAPIASDDAEEQEEQRLPTVRAQRFADLEF